MIGRSIVCIIPPERAGEEDLILERLRAGEALEHFETKRVARNGSVVDVSLSISPMRNSLGAIVGASTIMHDLTAHNLRDKALRRSEEQLRLALQGAHAAAWRLNILTCETECSPEAYALHGRDPESVKASYAEWLASVHADDRAELIAAVKDALEKRSPEIKLEYRVALPSGEIRWLAGLGKVEFADDGTPLETSGIHLDITDRKRAELSALASETALRRSQNRLRHAVDAGQLTYAEFDLRSGFATAAENYGRVMGYAPLREDGVLDVHSALARLVAHVAPEDRAGVGERIRMALSGEHPVVESEFRIVGDDGAIRWIRSVGEADLGANGRPSGFSSPTST